MLTFKFFRTTPRFQNYLESEKEETFIEFHLCVKPSVSCFYIFIDAGYGRDTDDRYICRYDYGHGHTGWPLNVETKVHT